VAGVRPASPETAGAVHLAGARALLVGTGSFAATSELAAVPAVATTLADLARLLVDRCGLADDAVRVVADPVSPMELGEAVATAAEQAARSLLVYYVGHGLVSQDGALYLATQTTDRRPTHLKHTALAYGTVRDYLLESAARSLVVVLDCCFSGLAAGSLGDPADEVVSLAEISGAYVLTSAGRDELALAPPGARHTGFSGALLRLLTDGDPDGPASLTLHGVYRSLSRILPAQGLPRPRCRFTGQIGELVLAPNPGYQPPASAESADLRSPEDDGPAVAVCPYKGLAAFEPEDAGWFFGRERLTTMLVGRLADRYDDATPLVVVGASGAGKSSLLRAGLLPALGRGELAVAGSATWPHLLFTPTADPVGALASRVAELAGVAAEPLAGELSADPVRLLSTLRRALRVRAGGRDAAGARVVLVVDQFEETFTQCADEHARQVFVRALCAAAHGGGAEPAALVVLGVRADFYGRCAAFPELLPALQDRQVVVGPMTISELRAAVEKPAAATGLGLQPGLVEVLLRDLGAGGPGLAGGDPIPATGGAGDEPGRLPLLSHALLATWQQRHGRTLTVAGYQATGGIHQAIAVTAERAFARLDAAGQQTARLLLLRLIQLGEGTEDTRRRVDRDRLIAELPDSARAAEVLDVFAAEDARLVTVDQDTVEITHDALLRAWPRLREWIDNDRTGLLVHQQLVEAAHAWERDRRDPTGLYRGSRLTLARDWAHSDQHRETLGPLAWAFLDASIQRDAEEQRAARRRARRRVQLTATLAGLLVVSLVTAGFAFQQQRAAEEQQLVATARQLTAQADVVRSSDPRLALLLGIAAHRLHADEETHASLMKMLVANRYSSTLTGHTGPVYSVAFSPDKRTLATGSHDRTVRLWDVTDPAGPATLGQPLAAHGDAVISVAFSPDGRTLATASADKTVRLWDMADVGRVRQVGTLTGHTGAVYRAAFSPDGRMLATGSADKSVRLWEIADPARPRRLGAPLTGHPDEVISVAFSPDGRTLATGSQAAVSLWDMTDHDRPVRLGKPLTSPSFENHVASVAFTPGGKTLAISTNDASDSAVVMLDVTNPARPRDLNERLTGHTSTVRSVAFAADGRAAATGSADKTVLLWSADQPGEAVPLTGHKGSVFSVAFSPDGRTLASGSEDHTVILWNVTAQARLTRVGELRAGRADWLFSVAFSPDGRTLATGGLEGTVRLWNVADPAHPSQLGKPWTSHASGWTVVAFAPDGRTLATGSRDRTVILWDVTDPARPARLSHLSTRAGRVTSVAFSPDGRTLATGTDTGDGSAFMLWNVADPAHPSQLGQPQNGPAFAVAFAPDGRTLATGGDGGDGGDDGAVVLWDLTHPGRPSQLGQPLDGPVDSVTSMAFASDRDILAARDADQTVIVWDVTDRARPARLPLVSPTGSASSMALTPDGRTLAIGSLHGGLLLWDVTDPAGPFQLGSPAGTELASGSADSLVASPDGRTLAANEQESVTLWSLSELIELRAHAAQRACELTDRGLNPDEWRRYISGLAYRDTCAS
jgi:WD40 repeat protein